MNLTYYGHACFAVVAGGKHILFDPFITGNDLAKNIRLEDVRADYIFVSHGHSDHMLDVVAIAGRTGAMVVGCWEVHSYFLQQGLKNVTPLNPGGKASYDFGTVKAVVAQHSSSFQDGGYAGVACGFVFKTREGNFYYSGDTGLTLEMTLIPRWAEIGFAVLPIGDRLTMGVEDAVGAAQFVKTTKVVGVHYDTWGGIRIDKAAAVKEFAGKGLTLLLPGIGESIEV